jgi:hypothetical protein
MSSALTEKYKDMDNQDLELYFILACTNNNLEEVKYFLTSPELEYHPSLIVDNEPLRLACFNNNLEMTKYFLTSPDLTEHANIYVNEADAFQKACTGESVDVLQYLVFEFHIEETQEIKEYLKNTDIKFNQTVKNMFILRDLNENLSEELSSDSSAKKKPKL